ncbi:hypothetical protein BHM03_00047067 [Ensete ventricosum]|nr:hypothetical protein BHM03_00047067 [Ensete ventricosum]
MQLGTRQECVGSSPRVSGVCQDSAREFARRRPRLARRLSGVSEKLVGRLTMIGAMKLQPDDGLRSSLGIGPGLDDAMRPRREFARRFAKGIGKLAGSTSGDSWKKTRRLTARMPEVVRLVGGLVFTQRKSVVDAVVPHE